MAATVPMTQTSSLESSPRLRALDGKTDDAMEIESGYGSATSSTPSLPLISLTPAHIKHINAQLEKMQTIDVLRFCRVLFPNLYQTTAFGLTGLVTLDMLSKLERETPGSSPVDLIFLDTLYHFPETYSLVENVKARYPNIKIHTFRPDGADTVAEFEDLYGEKLYDLSADMYDWIAKVEPQQRAYAELNVAAVLTGRRRSQGGARDQIPIIEVDDERGVIKINPMVAWSFREVQAYIRENKVPYNELLDRGYKSVGDWHSTSPVGEGEDERAGRWKGQAKTECGIHNKQSKYAQFLLKEQRSDPQVVQEDELRVEQSVEQFEEKAVLRIEERIEQPVEQHVKQQIEPQIELAEEDQPRLEQQVEQQVEQQIEQQVELAEEDQLRLEQQVDQQVDVEVQLEQIEQAVEVEQGKTIVVPEAATVEADTTLVVEASPHRFQPPAALQEDLLPLPSFLPLTSLPSPASHNSWHQVEPAEELLPSPLAV